jgi:ribonuclease Z
MSGTDLILTFLGTGATIPPIGRNQVSFALKHTNGTILFDCGEGTQFSLRKYKIPTKKEFLICISHLHSDHFLGIPGLLSSFQLQGRSQKIIFLGPTGIDELINRLIEANYIFIDYPIETIALQPNDEYKGKGYSIQAYKAKHEANALSFIWCEDSRPGRMDISKIRSLGINSGPLIGTLQAGKPIEHLGKTIRPEEVQGQPRRGRIIAYTGDTSPNDLFIKSLPANCDILIHEGTYPSDLQELARERGHSTLLDASEMAALGNVNQLIITHLSPRITNFKQELELIQTVFKNTKIAFEGLQVVIPFVKDQ